MNTNTMISTLKDREFWIAFLISAPILLLPVRNSAELPILIMAIAGVALIFRRRSELFSTPQTRYFSLLFFLIWLPIALSLPDSANFNATLKVAAGHLRFFLAGIFIINALRSAAVLGYFHKLISLILLFWVFDAMLQYALGQDLFGIPLNTERMNGLFGDNLKLGQMAAVLSPFLLLYMNRYPIPYRMIVWGGVFLVVLLSNSRASWVILAISMSGIFLHEFRLNKRKAISGMAAAFIAFFASSALLYTTSSSFEKRIDQTMLLFSGKVSKIDKALSVRLPIWNTALEMIESNPINGIGARSFRDEYFDYAATDDPFRSFNITPTHPHQMFLEIGSETGLLGLAGLLGLLILFGRSFFRSIGRDVISASLAISFLTAIFPINTHLAVYSSFWAMIIWWLAALHCSTSIDNGTNRTT